MADLDTTTKDLIEKHIDKIDKNDFITLFDEIIAEHDVKESEKVFNAMERADIEEANIEEVKKTYYNSHRIKQIKCYNVGFGDCFLCKESTDNGDKMLVDFGARKKDKVVINNVTNELSKADVKYLMLSHLHEDHYRGLKYVNVSSNKQFQFDEIYIPNYITNYGIEILGAVLLTSTNNTLINLVKEILRIPNLLAGFVSNSTNVQLLVEGNSVCNGLCAFDVLLPLKNKSYFNIKEFLPERIGVEIEEFSKQYKSLVGYNESEEYNCTISIHNDSLVNRIEQLIEQVVGLRNDVDLHINQSELKKIFERYHNALSLAFHEKYVKEYENVLFLGDAEPTDIKHLAYNNKLKNEYCFVKVQHHGTKRHFFDRLPSAKYYALPNGKSRKDCELSALYDCKYGRQKIFVCSNNINCELYKNNCNCNAKSKTATQCGFYPDYTVNIP